jgi:hypothetical protein
MIPTFSQHAREVATRDVAALGPDVLAVAQEAMEYEVNSYLRLGRPVSAAKVPRAAFAARAALNTDKGHQDER